MVAPDQLFFLFKLLQRLQHRITCIRKVLYNLTLLSGGLKTDLSFILIKLKVRIMLCRWCVCARGHVSCQRGAERGYIGPHNVWHETHESHHQVNMKHGNEHKKNIGSAHFPIQNRQEREDYILAKVSWQLYNIRKTKSDGSLMLFKGARQIHTFWILFLNMRLKS